MSLCVSTLSRRLQKNLRIMLAAFGEGKSQPSVRIGLSRARACADVTCYARVSTRGPGHPKNRGGAMRRRRRSAVAGPGHRGCKRTPCIHMCMKIELPRNPPDMTENKRACTGGSRFPPQTDTNPSREQKISAGWGRYLPTFAEKRKQS